MQEIGLDGIYFYETGAVQVVTKRRTAQSNLDLDLDKFRFSLFISSISAGEVEVFYSFTPF